MASIDRIKLFGFEYEVGPVNLGQDTFLNLLVIAYELGVKNVLARGRATDQTFDNFFLFPTAPVYGEFGNEIGYEFGIIAGPRISGVKVALNNGQFDFQFIKIAEAEWAQRLGDEDGWITYEGLRYELDNLETSISTQIYDHNSSPSAHADIRAKITADIAAHNIDSTAHADIRGDVNTRQLKSEKNMANGYVGLDANTKVPLIYLYDSVFGQVEYAGIFDASLGAYPTMTNALAPDDRPVRKGDYFITSVDGTVGGVDFKVGDWLIRNSTNWGKVDNTDAVASVNGKLGVVILDGTDLKVGAGDNTTIQMKIVSIEDALADRYTKAQTYSQVQIESRIMDLLALANLQDTAIEWSSGNYDLSYNGSVVSTFPATKVSEYNWVFVRVLVGTHAEYTMFKPSVSTSGVGLILPLQQKDVYASVKRVNGNYEFALYKKNDDTLSTTTATMKAWGIKLDGITDEEIATDFTTTNYLNGKVNQQEVNIELDAQIKDVNDKVDAEIGNVKGDITETTLRVKQVEEDLRKVVSGDEISTASGTNIISLGKDVAGGFMTAKIDGMTLQATQLLTNGDFSNGTTGWTAYRGIGVVSNGVYTLTGNTNDDYMAINRAIPVNETDKYYIASMLMTPDTVNRILLTGSTYVDDINNPTPNVWYMLSGIRTYLPANLDGRHVLQLSHTSINGLRLNIKNNIRINISTLIANKQYSPMFNTTFDLMSDANIKTQMDAWVNSGELPNDNIQSVNGNKRLRAVGKNLYLNDISVWTYTSPQSLLIYDNFLEYKRIDPNSYDYSIYEISVKKNTSYSVSYEIVAGNAPRFAIGRSMTGSELFSSSAQSGQISTTVNSAGYDKLYINIRGNGVGSFLTIKNIQIEESPAATSYTPYVSSELYLQANEDLFSLPNGVKDTIEYRNGKYYFVKRVGEYTLQASDIISMFTDGSTYNVANTGDILPLAVSQAVEVLDKNTFIGKMQEKITMTPYVVGTYYTSSQSKFRFLMQVGTTLEQARTQLTGTKIYYQLATPIETEIIASGNMVAIPNGSVYVENAILQASVYNGGITTAYNIKSIDKITRLNADGSTTTFTSGSTITNNTFTNTNLVDDDLVLFSYYYADTDSVYGRSEIKYENKYAGIGKVSLLDISGGDTNKKFIDGKVIKDYAEPKIIDSGWITLSLRNGWEHHATFPLRIRKIGNAVYLRGRLVGTNATGQSPCVIPVGYQIGSNQGGSDMIGSIDTYVFGRLDNNISSIYLNITNYTTITIWLNSTWLID